MPFKMHKITYFSRKKYACLPYLKFSDLLPKHAFFLPKFTGVTKIFFRFSGKNIILCILKGEMTFKMHKITFFFRKKKYAYPT